MHRTERAVRFQPYRLQRDPAGSGGAEQAPIAAR